MAPSLKRKKSDAFRIMQGLRIPLSDTLAITSHISAAHTLYLKFTRTAYTLAGDATTRSFVLFTPQWETVLGLFQEIAQTLAAQPATETTYDHSWSIGSKRTLEIVGPVCDGGEFILKDSKTSGYKSIEMSLNCMEWDELIRLAPDVTNSLKELNACKDGISDEKRFRTPMSAPEKTTVYRHALCAPGQKKWFWAGETLYAEEAKCKKEGREQMVLLFPGQSCKLVTEKYTFKRRESSSMLSRDVILRFIDHYKRSPTPEEATAIVDSLVAQVGLAGPECTSISNKFLCRGALGFAPLVQRIDFLYKGGSTAHIVPPPVKDDLQKYLRDWGIARHLKEELQALKDSGKSSFEMAGFKMPDAPPSLKLTKKTSGAGRDGSVPVANKEESRSPEPPSGTQRSNSAAFVKACLEDDSQTQPVMSESELESEDDDDGEIAFGVHANVAC